MIITVSRQFASGGREIGKRLSDALGLRYYDRELVTEIAKRTALNEGYVSKVLESGGYAGFAYTHAHTIPLASTAPESVTEVLVAQRNVIKSLGERGDCVIVGRCADAILSALKPVRIFVYADDESKIRRCRERAEKGESLSDKELLKSFKRIDKGRKKLHDLFSPYGWGDASQYDLMINTSGVEIEEIIAPLAALITAIDGKNK